MSPDPRSNGMNKPIELEDRMRGFAYFKDIYDAKTWTPKKVDVLQKANTPLTQRATPEDPDRKREQKTHSPVPKTSLMLMTDYNRYSPHEACQGAIRPEEEYFVQFWQYIDVFVYFVHESHISIPPPTWVNAGHRNGVQVLGLLIFEGDHHIDEQTAAMLEVDGDKYWLADKLAEMASCYGFDGWLLNMEAVIHGANEKTWRGGKAMDEFIEQLRAGLVKYGVPNGGKVIWYDSLLRTNEIEWQHTLNDDNLVFSQKAGSIIVDYPKHDPGELPIRKDEDVMKAGNKAVANDLTRDNVYLGQVIFASMANGPYLQPMANYGLGSGLFATGWCFQKFQPPPIPGADKKIKPPPPYPEFDMKTYRSDADRYMWTGESDPPNLSALKEHNVFGYDSDDNKNVIDDYIKKGNPEQCITRFAKLFPAGSDAFFYTNYGTAVDYKGPRTYAAHLGEQSIWPSHSSATLKLGTATTGKIFTKVSGPQAFGSRASCAIDIQLDRKPIANGSQADGSIILHDVNMRGDLSLNLSVKYKRYANLTPLRVFVFAMAGSQQLKLELTDGSGELVPQSLGLGGGHEPITAIGIQLQGQMPSYAPGKRIRVVDISEILVKPQENYETCKIDSVEFIQDGAAGQPYSRLNWNISPKPEEAHRPTHLPYSSVTGPVSHFIVSVGGKEVGRAHTLSFIFDQAAVTQLGGKTDADVDIAITGVAFDGTVFEPPYKKTLKWP